MKNYKYYLHNLDCANCAREIEEGLQKESKLQNVKVNFAKLQLTFEAEDDLDMLEFIRQKISTIEEDVFVSENKNINQKNHSLLFFGIGILCTIVSFFIVNESLKQCFLIAAYIFFLWKTFLIALKSIKNFNLNENVLIVISCIGAYLLKEYMEGLMVIFLYSLGKILEEKAVSKTRNSVASLMDFETKQVNLIKDDEILEVAPDDVQIGDVLLIRTGEKIPVDGIVFHGQSHIDTSSLTGESNPLFVHENDEVLSGCINAGENFELKVTSLRKDSTVSRILKLLDEATDKKAKRELAVSKWAKIYTPCVLGLAILVAIGLPFISNVTYEVSIYRALTFLVISCPCAIAISVPLSYFSGIGAGSKQGILFKGSDVLDAVRNIRTVVFDKTGTLTNGEFTVQEIHVLNNNYTKEDVFKYIYYAEKYSTHPLSKAILGYQKIKDCPVEKVEEIPGKGLRYVYKSHTYLVGNESFVGMEEHSKNTNIYLKVDEDVVGFISLEDSIKEEAYSVLEQLQKNKEVILLTGDNKYAAMEVANALHIKNYEFALSPIDKYEKVENLLKRETAGLVCFVGDGVNDAPVLSLSDIGISMGQKGSNAAIEASDIVIMNDRLESILKAFDISRKTSRIILQNLVFALGVKLLVLILSIFGFTTMWAAVFADVGVTILTILNTLRILK